MALWGDGRGWARPRAHRARARARASAAAELCGLNVDLHLNLHQVRGPERNYARQLDELGGEYDVVLESLGGR